MRYPDPDDIQRDEFGEPINAPSYEPYDELINDEISPEQLYERAEQIRDELREDGCAV